MYNPIEVNVNRISDLNKSLDLARESCGMLGMHSYKNFELYSNAIDTEHWNLLFTPSKINADVGFIKMRPKTPVANNALDKGRTERILDRHPLIKYSIALKLARLFKRNRHTQKVKTQDFLIRNCSRRDIPPADDATVFYTWANTLADKGGDKPRFNIEETKAMRSIISSVANILSSKQHKANKANAHVKSDDVVAASLKPLASVSATSENKEDKVEEAVEQVSESIDTENTAEETNS